MQIGQVSRLQNDFNFAKIQCIFLQEYKEKT